MKSIIQRCSALLAIVFLSSITIDPIHPLQISSRVSVHSGSKSGARDAGLGGEGALDGAPDEG